MDFDADRAIALLRLGTGDATGEFRPGQLEAIRHVVTGAGRLLVVRKTGWGKSFVYFIATKMLREAGFGPGLLVSPLLSLMRNQIAAATSMGIAAETINSSNRDEWERVEGAVEKDAVDLLLVAPERFANDRFRERLLGGLAGRISLLVIDEAHCVSDWGHDFRPHYRMIERIARLMPSKLRLLATTATANDRVMQDLEETIGPGLAVSRGDLARPSLTLQTIRLPGQAERFAWLAERLRELPGSGIVYTLTVRDAERVAAWLRHRGFVVEAYTGALENDVRVALEDALLANEVKALVATTALGMGFDKPDLGFVVHYQAPGSVVAYYQQVGRAGRGVDAAYGVLLAGSEDTEITDYFIRSAFPTRAEVDEVIGALEDSPEGLRARDMEATVNVSRGRIDKALQLLSLESPAPVVREEGVWQLTAATLGEAFWDRTERLGALRREEQAQMQAYVSLSDGHMDYLIRALDGEAGASPGPVLPLLATTVEEQTVSAATAFLRSVSPIISARRLWPTGTRIEPDHRVEPGRALCQWGDGGWGPLVRRGKYADGRFDEALVRASADLVRRWGPAPAPGWVAAIPSQRHPDLVPDFARRLAGALGLPYREVLSKKGNRPEQKSMANSDGQARNVIGSLGVDEAAMLAEPVLLVDDVVDSRWTFTVAAWELTRRGCKTVWPFALADAGMG